MMEILLLILVAALIHMKKHKPSCGGSCAACGLDCRNKQKGETPESRK